MHDFSTRASQYRRRASALCASALAAVLFSQSASAASPVDEGDQTSSIDRTAAHEIRIEFVKPGREGLELSAKLTEDGGTINRPIGWKIHRSGGETIYEGETPIADMIAEPGDYDIELSYGTVKMARSVALLAEQRLGVSFVLNVGGIRVLPRIVDLGLPLTRTRTQVYATSGQASGQLIAASSQPGEIIRVAAGSYRIETRFEPGNTVASAEVRVKPGIMSAVEIDHLAGLAHLRLAGADAGDVSWSVSTEGMEPLKFDSAAADVVLKPGSYTARASSGGQEFSARFSIAAGESRDIILGQ